MRGRAWPAAGTSSRPRARAQLDVERSLHAVPPHHHLHLVAWRQARHDLGEVVTPRNGRSILSPRTSCGSTWRTVLDGTANPMPTLPWLVPPVAICVFT